MATKRSIKLRIRGTKNIKQITKAMEAVSAVKMRKSQEVALRARPFAIAALSLLRTLSKNLSPEERLHSELLRRRAVKTSYLVVLSSDKGLAGSFNANILKRAESYLRGAASDVRIVAIGKKASQYFRRRGKSVAAEFFGSGDFVELEEVRPLASFLEDAFRRGECDEAVFVYTNFLSAMRHDVVLRTLLPIDETLLSELASGISPITGRFVDSRTEAASSDEPARGGEYLLEPSPAALLEAILPELLLATVYHVVLEANASEHSSRMIAMRNASDNAGDLIKEYTVLYNKARQGQINKELAEISAGAEILQN